MYIRRAVLPATPEEDATPSPNLALLPLLSLSVVALILIFFVMRFVKRGMHFSWFRGKSKGAKGRLGLSGVELLPTSFKSVPASSPSPFSAAFNLEGNAGKSGNSTLLSRSSSLDALPQLSASSSPHLTSRKRSDWRAPLSLPTFLQTKTKALHRRSRSLSTSHHTTSLSMPTSAPPTPSPKTLLIDISASGSSPMSASSDLGTHKLHSASPLIPGLPIPTPSPVKMKPISKNGTQAWTFDVEDESHDIAESHGTDPLLAAFKRSPSKVHMAKPPADPMPLIQYDRPSSSPPPTPPLVPKRLSTPNPFASLADSFTSQTFISDRPSASSSSLPLMPSFPPGIELVPIRPTAVQSTTDLLDLSNDDVEAGHENSITLSAATIEPAQVIFADPLVTANVDMGPTHDILVETVIDPAGSVSDPFDDSHAITLPTGASDEWNSGSGSSSLVEESHLPPAELAPPIQSSEPPPVHAVPLPASPLLLPSQVKPIEIEKPSPAEPEPLTSSWQWNGSWSPSIVPVPQLASEWPSVTIPLGRAPDKDTNLAEPEVGVDLMSFDHEEPISADEMDVKKEMDPADTWFIEEPTAVWDVSWTGENVKEGAPLDMGQEKGMEGDAVDMLQEEHINVLDELLAGPSEPIKIHIFEEMLEDPVSEQPLPEDSDASAATTSSNDNHDVHEIIMPHSNIPTPIIHAATPLPSTPATPNSPLPELPSPVPVAPSPIVEEYPDPDIMPLPDLPPLSVAPTPISPMPIKPRSPSIHQAQTPTPPDSPQPWSNAPARPLWSLRAADAPVLGLSAATIIPPVPELHTSEEVKPVVEVGSQKDEANRGIAADNAAEEDVVEKVRIEPAADELPRELEEKSNSTKSQPGPSTSIPGSFPASPSKTLAALPADTVSTFSTASTDHSSTKTPQTRAAIPTSNRIRTPRSVIDIALAMQLRPGLGAGADPAWMVRFLMAVFGWFAILVSGDL
ncbi:hypothetical protein C0995_014018 [Termitomyces sp. Mi166|nr:hypothetical protein C0995_014018 [Termitomyces sp. Mi166\